MAWTLLQPLLAGLAVAQWSVCAAPLGALQARDDPLEAQEDTHVITLGAPESFSLFFPELPRSRGSYKTEPSGSTHTLNSKQDTSSLPHTNLNPVKGKKVPNIETSEVPVIDIPGKSDNILGRNESPSSLLDMFPEDLLSSDKKIKPVKVHIIEHDDYIDYEIEFVELPDDMDFSSDEIAHFIRNSSDTTAKESENVDKFISTDMKDGRNVTDTFLGLLEEARLRHRDKMSKTKTRESVPIKKKIHRQDASKRRRTKVHPRVFQRKKMPRRISNQSPIAFSNYYTSSNQKSNTRNISALREKLLNFQRSTTPSSSFATSSVAFSSERSTTTGSRSQNKPLVIDDLSKLVIQTLDTQTITSENIILSTEKNEETTEHDGTTLSKPPVRNNELQFSLPTTPTDSFTTKMTIAPTTQTSQNMIDIETTTIHLNTNSTEILTTEDIKGKEAEQVTTAFYTGQPATVISSIKWDAVTEETTIPSTGNDNLERHDSNGRMDSMSPELDDLEGSESEIRIDLHFGEGGTSLFPEEARSPSFESKRGSINEIHKSKVLPKKMNTQGEELEKIIRTTSKYEATTINTEDGSYHEMNPGQYHEVNPGQYHESNPGQYKEVHPGQYHEVNPGQYTEKDLGVENVTVDFNSGKEDDTKTYNLKANAGDFIIGEVGIIDVNSGQTLQGVRWTARSGEVDEARISEILQSVFDAKIN